MTRSGAPLLTTLVVSLLLCLGGCPGDRRDAGPGRPDPGRPGADTARARASAGRSAPTRGIGERTTHGDLDVRVDEGLEGLEVRRARIVVRDNLTRVVIVATAPRRRAARFRLAAMDARGVEQFAASAAARPVGKRGRLLRLELDWDPAFVPAGVHHYALDRVE